MRETMKYNPCYYQLREGQLERMLSIVKLKVLKKMELYFLAIQ